MSIDELIRRVEGASKGSRELDAEIAAAAKTMPDDMEPAFGQGYWRGKYDDRHWRAPDYTTSLDAAMTLVPEGWFVNSIIEYNQRTWDAVLRGPWTNDPDRTRDYVGGRSDIARGIANPAIAVTAAALRARALASKPAEGEGL